MDRDSLLEILQLIIRNPLRIGLSMVGISWGVMGILITLGMVSGLRSGIESDLGDRAANSMFLWTMSTTKPYAGYQAGRWFDLKNSDVDWLRANVPEIQVLCPRLQLGGYRGSNNVTRGTNTGAFNVYGDYPDYIEIEPMVIDQGRYINGGDIKEKRKICVIGKEVERILFESGEKAVGGEIRIQGVIFTVVGVYKSAKEGEDALEDAQSIFIPFSTFQKAFNVGDEIGWLSLTSHEDMPIQELSPIVINALKTRKSVHPDDNRAFGTWNMGEELEEVQTILGAMAFIGYFVGALILFAGIVSITNIMLITVNERTKEFGIRRALGARPWRIIFQVMKENLFLTIVAGSVGLIGGVMFIRLIAWLTSSMGDAEVFRDPRVSFSMVVGATIVLIVFGLLGALLPAFKAVAIRPVNALRADG